MSERPIIFSTEMVRAILEGRKTQTRRVIKVPWYYGKRVQPFDPYYVEEDGKLLYQDAYGDFHPIEEICPYGQPGDILWVRETWCEAGVFGCAYKATDTLPVSAKNGWRPSIHMPRQAARLFLFVKNVRAERLQDITEEDARAEGAIKAYPTTEGYYLEDPQATYKGGFSALWDSIYAKRGYGWEANPWVWVVEFERVA